VSSSRISIKLAIRRNPWNNALEDTLMELGWQIDFDETYRNGCITKAKPQSYLEKIKIALSAGDARTLIKAPIPKLIAIKAEPSNTESLKIITCGIKSKCTGEVSQNDEHSQC